MAYQLDGRMLEVCSCETICPCFIAENPDGGICQVVVAWHIDGGDIEGVDVAGCTIAAVARIPGKPLDGEWRAAVYVDDGASEAQEKALLDVFTGKHGGAIADVASLIGEVVGVERAAIAFEADKGKGTLKIGDVADATIEPFVTKDGSVATLSNTLFSGSPGASALLGRAPHFHAKHDGVGVEVDLVDHSAVECEFSFQG
jgi:hypothetical protein